MAKTDDRRLNTPEDMLALAEELAARHPAQTSPRAKGPALPLWLRNGLWFTAGAGTASLLWWAGLLR